MLALMDKLRMCETFKACPGSLEGDIERESPGLASRIRFKSGQFEMIQQHRRIDSRDFFWLANNTGKAQDCTIALRDIQGSIAIWNCETGRIRPVAARLEDEETVVDLSFGPYEAFWLVCDLKGRLAPAAEPRRKDKVIEELKGDWEVRIDLKAQPPLEFEPVIPEELLTGVHRPLQEWESWALKRFSGYIDYNKTIELDQYSGRAILDLGRVCHLAQVWVNGRDVGSRLWPPFEFDITDAVRPGQNEVRIRVGNLTHSNYGQKAASGLFGPVQINQTETQ